MMYNIIKFDDRRGGGAIIWFLRRERLKKCFAIEAHIIAFQVHYFSLREMIPISEMVATVCEFLSRSKKIGWQQQFEIVYCVYTILAPVHKRKSYRCKILCFKFKLFPKK